LLLFGAVAMAWFYPLTRERHARVRDAGEEERADDCKRRGIRFKVGERISIQ
jgi:hypothetical protein